MKPSILVPVDFTDNAFNAYRYANNLAYYLDCNLHLVHVVPQFSDIDDENATQFLEERLRSFSSWHPNEISEKFFPVPTSLEVLYGDTVREIVKRGEDVLFRFIVCATREQHTLKDKWLGTVSSGIALDATIPVILVPKSAEFSNLDSIVVGCDDHARDDNVLSEIAALSDWFGSNVHFVHVLEKSEQEFVVVERDILETLVTLQKKALKVEMITVKGLDIVSSIFNYAGKIKADLLIMISEKRNFLRKLLFQSMSRKAALETSVPTMFMHIS